MVCYAAESGIGLSCGNAAGTNTMPETVTVDGPPVAKSAATVGPSALALHLDCSRTYIDKLEAEGVIQRQGDGFPLDQSRVAYLRYLRRERRQSPRSEAAADHVKVKTEMLQLKLAQQKGEIVSKADFDAMIDTFAGVTLTALSSLPARCAPRGDLATRRAIERAVFEVRTEIAKICLEMADKCGEPPLERV
jgi:phage terminase Nu1 subunit (DNA packaging protein)